MADPPSTDELPAASEAARKPPLLASQALKDDLAPLEPYRLAARIGCLLAAMVFAATAAPAYSGVTEAGSGYVQLTAAGLSLLLAALPLGYAVRAIGMLLLGLGALAAGLLGAGPVGALVLPPGVPASGHTVLASAALAGMALPAALLFRARYRAYAGARRTLAAALLATLPFGIVAGLALASGALAQQVAAAVALAAIAPALLGFMGSQTTIGGQYLAGLVVASLGGVLACEALLPRWPLEGSPSDLWAVSAVAGFVAGVGLAALGAFQVLAWRHWGRARQVQALSQRPTIRQRLLSLSDTWSSRP